MEQDNNTNYCGFGHSKATWLRPPFWYFQNASCKIHDENYENGGTRLDRLTADVGFLWRMLNDANKQETYCKKRNAAYSAILYFMFVRLFGWLSFFVWNYAQTFFKKKI